LKTIRFSSALIIFVVLNGCGSPPLIVASTHQPTKTATFLSEPSQSLPPHGTQSPPTTSFTIQSFCPEVALNIGELPTLAGTIILSGEEILINDSVFSPDLGQKSILVFWDAQTGKKTTYQLPEHQQYYYYVTSPNKERIAFTEGKTQSMSSDVIVLTNFGEEAGIFNLLGDWTLFDWLDVEKLLIRQLRTTGESTDLVALNWLTGERQFLPSNFPNIYSKELLFFWGALTIFDPTASFVAYPERKDNEILSVLWDVQNNREIARVAGGSWLRWSLDGSRLLVVVDYESKLHETHDEIFLIDSQGNVLRSTFFKDYLENNQINLPAWSPDGRYVAFWLSAVLPVKTAQLAILDTETATVDLYCNEMAPFPFRFGDYSTLGYAYYQVNSALPIWSPDSKYLLIENYQQFTSSTYLFDLERHAVTKIADNSRPISWMK
jgi:hypothetical protein